MTTFQTPCSGRTIALARLSPKFVLLGFISVYTRLMLDGVQVTRTDTAKMNDVRRYASLIGSRLLSICRSLRRGPRKEFRRAWDVEEEGVAVSRGEAALGWEGDLFAGRRGRTVEETEEMVVNAIGAGVTVVVVESVAGIELGEAGEVMVRQSSLEEVGEVHG